MPFEKYFRLSSLLMIACGALALVAAGGVGLPLAAAFALALMASWRLEGSRFQPSERVGLLVVLASLPFFYFEWRAQFASGATGDAAGGAANAASNFSALIHFTLFLSAVKLLQRKADRDWFFLYLLSFFEILLAAGLSVSAQFLAALVAYTLCALSTIIAFEMRKASRRADAQVGASRIVTSANLKREASPHDNGRSSVRAREGNFARRLPLVAFALLVLIFAAALPLFLFIPRFGGSAFASSSGAMVRTSTGFSDEVTLGDIGRLQQNNQIVMRVSVENLNELPRVGLRWRGVALDYFNGVAWRRRADRTEIAAPNERNQYLLGERLERTTPLTVQAFILEPLDTGALFAAPRAVAVQGALSLLQYNREGGTLETAPHTGARLGYTVYSDTRETPAELLRRDNQSYTAAQLRYLQLPATPDPRIWTFATKIVSDAHATNRYDQALAIESYLRQNYGYTLDLKAGGRDPLADFLFHVREGHCEYFATAMAVMLRTRGIASRIVNGFQAGSYNDAANVYTVRQRDAHSWVEVYFPQTNSWVAFDPTPAAGFPSSQQATGLRATLGKYAEAFELLWIRYVVAYDKQEQRTLARNVGARVNAYRRLASLNANELRAYFTNFWRSLFDAHDSSGNAARSILRLVSAVIALSLIALFAFLAFRVRRFGWRRAFARQVDDAKTTVEFYERMTKALAARGMTRPPDETPREFAARLNIPEALTLTDAYHRVRYGAQSLSSDEIKSIEIFLNRIESEKTAAV